MNRKWLSGTVVVLLLLSGTLWAADVVLNEYNAVDGVSYLGGGDSSSDDMGGRAADRYFGRVPGNGGNWFELVVVKDHLDMRNWQLDTYVNAKADKTLILTNDPVWSDLRASTIITVAQDVPTDVSYDPAAGDWWINVQAKTGGEAKYISAKSFTVNNKNWQLRIRNNAGLVVFGPAGEGVSPAAGVGSTEVFQLKGEPNEAITAASPKYGATESCSTFGSPNQWGGQDFNDVRPVLEPKKGSISVLSPSGGESFTSGKVVTVRWQSEGVSERVLVEFSIDEGYSWTPVYPLNVGNTGQYKWLVPLVDSTKAFLRVSSTTRPFIYGTNAKPFTIVSSGAPVAGLTSDGRLDFSALALWATTWLN